jgi:hypothetical protein
VVRSAVRLKTALKGMNCDSIEEEKEVGSLLANRKTVHQRSDTRPAYRNK